ncbi:MAG: glycosyltransferase [Sphingomonas fennica]
MKRLAVIGARGIPDVIGGVETHCALLYPALAEAMPALAVTLLARRIYVPAARFRHEGVEVHGLPSPRGASIETLLHSLISVLYARFRLRADIVHLHGIGPGFFAPLARLIGMRVVVTDHAADFLRPKWGLAGRAFLRLGEWLAARYADRLICVSDAVRQDLLTRAPDAAGIALTIRLGAHLADAPPEGDAALLARFRLEPNAYLLAVARLEETKRIEDLIAAHAAAGPGTLPLVIAGCAIGDDSYERRLRAMAGPGVIFAGVCHGALLTALYRRAALLLHPSEMEGFALVILEALSVGTPVKVSDLPVHREFALPDDAFFAVGDVAAIRATMERTGPRTAPWTPAASIVERHSEAAVVRAHADLYGELLGLTADQPAPAAYVPAARASNSRQ